jgi:hypothetical protein
MNMEFMKNIPGDAMAFESLSRQSEPASSSTTTIALNAAANSLPPANTKRWVTRRKAEVVNAVRAGIISLDEACRRYKLSIEEFASWQALIDHHGLAGLRATRVQDYRGGPKPRS